MDGWMEKPVHICWLPGIHFQKVNARKNRLIKFFSGMTKAPSLLVILLSLWNPLQKRTKELPSKERIHNLVSDRTVKELRCVPYHSSLYTTQKHTKELSAPQPQEGCGCTWKICTEDSPLSLPPSLPALALHSLSITLQQHRAGSLTRGSGPAPSINSRWLRKSSKTKFIQTPLITMARSVYFNERILSRGI